MRELLQTNAISIVIHALAGLIIAYLAPVAIQAVTGPDKVTFDLIEIPPEEPVAVEEPVPPPPEPAPIAPRPPRLASREVERPRPFQETPQPGDPSDLAEVEAPRAPVPTVSMESVVGSGAAKDYSTTTGGGLKVQPGAGGEGGAGARGEVGALAGQHGVEVSEEHEVSRYPEPLNDRGFEPDYPPLARHEQREAQVIVALWIDEQGNVVDAQVVEPAGHGFDEAALRYARRLRFRPAMAGPRAVATKIEWTVEFRARD